MQKLIGKDLKEKLDELQKLWFNEMVPKIKHFNDVEHYLIRGMISERDVVKFNNLKSELRECHKGMNKVIRAVNGLEESGLDLSLSEYKCIYNEIYRTLKLYSDQWLNKFEDLIFAF